MRCPGFGRCVWSVRGANGCAWLRIVRINIKSRLCENCASRRGRRREVHRFVRSPFHLLSCASSSSSVDARRRRRRRSAHIDEVWGAEKLQDICAQPGPGPGSAFCSHAAAAGQRGACTHTHTHGARLSFLGAMGAIWLCGVARACVRSAFSGVGIIHRLSPELAAAAATTTATPTASTSSSWGIVHF